MSTWNREIQRSGLPAELAVDLMLGEAFTPVCHVLAEVVLSTPSDRIKAYTSRFQKAVLVPPYAFDAKKGEQIYMSPDDLKAQVRDYKWFEEELLRSQQLSGQVLGEHDQDVNKSLLESIAFQANGLTKIADYLEAEGIRDGLDDFIPQLPNEQKEKFKKFLEHVRRNARLHDHNYLGIASGQYDRYVLGFAETKTGKEDAVIENIVAPVGAYGLDFARSLHDATKVMFHLSEDYVNNLTLRVEQRYGGLIRQATARGRDNRINPVMETLQEGILTIANSIHLCMAEKLQEYDDPSILLQEIIRQGFINRLSLMVPMGLIGPCILSGRYIPNLIEIDDKAGLTFGARVRQNIAIAKRLYQEKDLDILRGFTGLGCPVGKRKVENNHRSGIEDLSQAFLYVWQSLKI